MTSSIGNPTDLVESSKPNISPVEAHNSERKGKQKTPSESCSTAKPCCEDEWVSMGQKAISDLMEELGPSIKSIAFSLAFTHNQGAELQALNSMKVACNACIEPWRKLAAYFGHQSAEEHLRLFGLKEDVNTFVVNNRYTFRLLRSARAIAKERRYREELLVVPFTDPLFERINLITERLQIEAKDIGALLETCRKGNLVVDDLELRNIAPHWYHSV